MTFEEWKENYSTATEADYLSAFKAGATSRDAEIAELREVSELGHSLFAKQLIENDQLRAELAAEQAKNVGLREKVQKFIESLEECTDFEGLTAYIATMDDYHETVEAIATPSDTSALEALVKKAGEVMREWCLALREAHLVRSEAIRALPAMTLEDLK